MYTFLLIVQVALAVALIVLILLQQGKGADAGAAFGSGASATVFGARGAGNFLSRTTGILATLFFANSLLLSTPLILGDRKGPASVTEQVPLAPDAGKAADTKTPADLPDAPAAPVQQSAPSDLPTIPAAPSPKSGPKSGTATDAPQEKSGQEQSKP
ncbi:MAG: preprotein translocase subunit SecG [Gammaproteobacteria bacterium]|nr:preprotein translocase subunit SecG [Gammaproteobacteria bacterium]